MKKEPNHELILNIKRINFYFFPNFSVISIFKSFLNISGVIAYFQEIFKHTYFKLILH
jgi:hypothetical protein